MTDWPILSTVTFLPLVGVFLLLLTREDSTYGRRNILNVSLLTTVFTFVVSLFIWIGFDNSNPGFQMVEKSPWLGTGISYHLGVDGISMLARQGARSFEIWTGVKPPVDIMERSARDAL